MRNSTSNNQQGFVAIFSVLIIMGILTLLTIGFSNATRQAQLRTLNDHLNNQAFYAAESGVNMASTALVAGQNVSQKSECRNGGAFNYDVDDDNNIAVSCLLINGNPPNLEFSTVPVVGVGEPVVSYLSTLNTSTAGTLRLDWDSETDSDAIRNRSNADFLPVSAWGTDVGVVRVDLVPAGSTDRSTVVNSSYTFYLYPSLNGTTSFSANPGYGGQGATMVTRCNPSNGYSCSAEVNLSGSTSSSYYIRLQSYYKPVRARVAVLDSADNEVTLQNGQAVVDATGQANDVYRRIQVRIPITPDAGFTTGIHDVFSIFSGDSVCKRYVGISGNTVVDPPCQF